MPSRHLPLAALVVATAAAGPLSGCWMLKSIQDFASAPSTITVMTEVTGAQVELGLVTHQIGTFYPGLVKSIEVISHYAHESGAHDYLTMRWMDGRAGSLSFHWSPAPRPGSTYKFAAPPPDHELGANQVGMRLSQSTDARDVEQRQWLSEEGTATVAGEGDRIVITFAAKVGPRTDGSVEADGVYTLSGKLTMPPYKAN